MSVQVPFPICPLLAKLRLVMGLKFPEKGGFCVTMLCVALLFKQVPRKLLPLPPNAEINSICVPSGATKIKSRSDTHVCKALIQICSIPKVESISAGFNPLTLQVKVEVALSCKAPVLPVKVCAKIWDESSSINSKIFFKAADVGFNKYRIIFRENEFLQSSKVLWLLSKDKNRKACRLVDRLFRAKDETILLSAICFSVAYLYWFLLLPNTFLHPVMQWVIQSCFGLGFHRN